MAFKVADRVKEIIFTPGTGNIVLSGSGVEGFQSFQSALSDNDYTYYVIDEYESWETGYGQFANGEFSRELIFDSSYNSGERIHIAGSGAGHLSITYPASRSVYLDQDNLYANVGSGIIFTNDAAALTTSSGLLYWDNNQLAYESDNLYVSGIASYASGQSLLNQQSIADQSNDIAYVSGISAYASGQVLSYRKYQNSTSNIIASLDDDIIFVDSTSSQINVYMPMASGNGGKEFMVKRIAGDNIVTIVASGAEQIDGETTYDMHHLYQCSTLVSNNLNWYLT